MSQSGRSLSNVKNLLVKNGPLLALLVVSAALYWSTAEYKLSWDDELFLLKSPKMAQPSSLKSIFDSDFWGLTDTPTLQEGSPLYRPFTLGFLILERTLLGTETSHFRLVHMLLHLVNIALVFAFARRMLNKRSLGPFLAASVFAFMPYTVDTVLFLTSVSDLMALCFMLLACLSFLTWIERSQYWQAGGVVLASAAAMLCKESAVSIPVVLGAVYWRYADVTKHKRAIAVIGLTVLVVAGFFLIRSQVIAPIPGTSIWGMVTRLPADLALAFRYAVVPYPLVLETEVTHRIGGLAWWLGCVGIVAVVSGFLLFGRNLKPVFIGSTIWIVSVVPSLMALQWTGVFALRYLYVPALGLGLIAGYIVSFSVRPVKILIGVLVLLLGLGTAARTTAWKDSLTLFAVEVGHQPRSLTALINLGNLLMKQGKYKQAFAFQLKAAKVAKDKGRHCTAGFAYSNAATLLSAYLGDPESSLALYKKCIQQCPKKAQNAWIGLAQVYAQRQLWEKAEHAALKASEFATKKTQTRVFLAGIFASQGKRTEALRYLDEARVLIEDDPLIAQQIAPGIKSVQETLKHSFERHKGQATPQNGKEDGRNFQ